MHDSARSPWCAERIDTVLGWTLIRAYLLRAPRFVQVLNEVGLTPTQLGVLIHLEVDHELSQASLARRLLMTPQSMGELLASLEQMGHVRRGSRPGRGHAIPVSLTSRGSEILNQATPLVLAGNTPESFGLSAEEAVILNLLLHKVIHYHLDASS